MPSPGFMSTLRKLIPTNLFESALRGLAPRLYKPDDYINCVIITFAAPINL